VVAGAGVPYENETVLHVRGFNIEMPRQWHNLGFDELDPNRTAFELLGHLSPQNNDQVALISRFDKTHMQPYVDALALRNIPARSIDGNSGKQDFCILLKATRGVAGTEQSTFLSWSVYLSNSAQRTVLYHMNTTRRQDRIAVTGSSGSFTPTNPQFQKRNMSFPLFSMPP
jgi:hypothetical protein